MLSDDSGEIIPQRGAIGDGPSGIAMAAGILAALLHARATGRGVEVNTSLYSMGIWTMAPDIALTSLTGEVPPRRPGSTAPMITQPGSPIASRYNTADGRMLALSMTNEARYWPRACRALGLDDLIEPYGNREDRDRDADKLHERFATVIGSLTATEAAAKLKAEDCTFGFV